VDVVANNWNFRIRFAYVSYRERLRIQSGGLLSAQLEHWRKKNTSRIEHTGVILARLNGEEKSKFPYHSSLLSRVDAKLIGVRQF